MSKYKTKKFLKKKMFRRYWRISLSVILVIVILYAISFWSKHESMEIKDINVVGNRFIDSELVKKIFYEETKGNYLLLFSKKNFLVVPKRSIANKIEENLSVKNVRVKSTGSNSVEINIIEHKPVARFCMIEKCYLVNSNGLIFLEEPVFVIEDLIDLEANLEGDILGQNFTDQDIFNQIIRFTELLGKIDIHASKIKTEDRETFIVETKRGVNLLIGKNDDPVELINNLNTTLEQETITEIQFQNLEYIDLRFGNKVYYKIR